MKRLVMRRAWALARAGSLRWGGSVRAYFSSALRVAWRELRSPSPASPEFLTVLWLALLAVCLGCVAPVAVVACVTASGLPIALWLLVLALRRPANSAS